MEPWRRRRRYVAETMNEVEKLPLVDSWYRQFYDRLVDFLHQGVRNRADAQDIAQEVYLRMLRVKSPELIESPRAYLYRVAIHVLDEWRSKERRKNLQTSDDIMDLIAMAGAYDDTQQKDLSVDLTNALNELPAAQTATLILRWHHGMGYREIAEHLKVSERQIKRYIVKGYTALRSRLEPALDTKLTLGDTDD